MTEYLLDTNVCIALLNREPVAVRQAFNREVSSGARFFMSTVVEFELRYGAAKSQHRDSNTNKLNALLMGPFESAPFDADDAAAAGEIRAELAKLGTPIGPYDVQIAGQARRRAD